jgi:hypothetical protein
MSSIEYMCTKELSIKTGINRDTVKLSKLKLHDTFSGSLSTHLKRFIIISYRCRYIIYTYLKKRVIIANMSMRLVEQHYKQLL